MAKHKKPILSPLTPDAEDLYFEAMELIESGPEGPVEALQLLEQAYELEPKSVATQIGFVHAFGVLGHTASVHAHIEQAYQRTRQEFTKWPKRLLWGVIENRPYLRAIHYKADRLADEGENEEALKLYRLLLELNPSDNQGVRYLVAGMYAGISGEEVNALTDEGNMKQDWSKMEKMLERENKKHKFWKEPTEDDFDE